MVPRAIRLLCACGAATAALASATGAQAQTQGNPFQPQSAGSRLEIERVVDARMKDVEARITAATAKVAPVKGGATGTSAGAPGSPVSPGSPGAPIGGAGPLSPGGAAGGPNYPAVGAVGAPGALGAVGAGTLATLQLGPIEQARASDTRFLGCINGVHKFVKQKTGERVTFTDTQINHAVKDGSLPACR